MLTGLRQAGVNFQSASMPNRMIVISDGDVAANFVRNPAAEEWLPLGFNRFENTTYANKELMLNAVEYLIDATGVIEARSKEVKLRLLDTVRAGDEKTFWQALNLGVPLAFLGLFGLIYFWLRRRKYARKPGSLRVCSDFTFRRRSGKFYSEFRCFFRHSCRL